MFDRFIEGLRSSLNSGLPGKDAQFEMAAEGRRAYSYDFENIKGYRESAVCLFLFEKNGEIVFPLIERVKYPGVHSGQLALPGGKTEAGDMDFVDTALREMEEETGIKSSRDSVLGSLTKIYIPPSNFMVYPVVAFGQQPSAMVHNPKEVEQIIEFGVKELLNDSIIGTTTVAAGNGTKVKTPYFEVRGKVLWGATAMMLNEFKVLIKKENLLLPS